MKLIVISALGWPAFFAQVEKTNLDHKHSDFWPPNIENVGRMFQTMKENPDPVTLKYQGRVPRWLRGSFYRNGPGKYEYGNQTFTHFFDPSAIVQQFEIKDSEIQYNSRFIRTRNYLANNKENRIVYPEIGTWAEDWTVSHNEDGSPIEDDATLAKVETKQNY